MEKKIVAILCILAVALPMVALIAPAKADLDDFAWVEPAYKGHDSYYNRDITGYLENSNWNLTLSWTNYYSYPVNISTVRVLFDWGKNYTHRFATPVQLKHDEYKTFTVYNMTPSVEVASEMWTHYYDIYLDQVNATTGPFREWQLTSDYGSNFAVLSADHLACLNLWMKYTPIFGSSGAAPGMMYYGMPFYTNITKVQIYFSQAYMEFYQGMSIFEAGVFGSAKTHLQSADTLFNQAITTWDTSGTAIEDARLAGINAQTAYYNALADASKKQADAATINSIGWLFFGLGWTLLGLGLIIYATRRPKPPAQPPQ